MKTTIMEDMIKFCNSLGVTSIKKFILKSYIISLLISVCFYISSVLFNVFSSTEDISILDFINWVSQFSLEDGAWLIIPVGFVFIFSVVFYIPVASVLLFFVCPLIASIKKSKDNKKCNKNNDKKGI